MPQRVSFSSPAGLLQRAVAPSGGNSSDTGGRWLPRCRVTSTTWVVW